MRLRRVTSTISRLDQQIRTSEQTRTEMATNLNSMLQTLKDGVVLFTADLRVAMAGEAVANFLPAGASVTAGTPLPTVFSPDTAIGRRLAELLQDRQSVRAVPVLLEDGRTIELSLNCFTGKGMGALLMLHDSAVQEEVEREIEVSRRLASIGRLTAGVGHEVKNPINAMVVHLELLRGKLAKSPDTNGAAASRGSACQRDEPTGPRGAGACRLLPAYRAAVARAGPYPDCERRRASDRGGG